MERKDGGGGILQISLHTDVKNRKISNKQIIKCLKFVCKYPEVCGKLLQSFLNVAFRLPEASISLFQLSKGKI